MPDIDESLTDHRGNFGPDVFPDADRKTLERIAFAAQKKAEEEEAKGKSDGSAHLAAQSEYGCAWQWGDGSSPVDEDIQPRARVYDCDGNTIESIEDPRENMRRNLIERAHYLDMSMKEDAPDVIVANELRLIAKFGAIYLGRDPE